MSLSEFIVIVIVSIFLIKPSDVSIIISQIKQIFIFTNKIKYEIFKYFKDPIMTNNEIKIEIQNVKEAKNEFLEIIQYDLDILNNNKNI